MLLTTPVESPLEESRRTHPRLSRWLTISAWASLALNLVIIATGGAVRLTGSGLGCSDWPLCTPGNLFPTAAQSYHALVEFGNRTVSAPLALAAVGTLVLTWWLHSNRRDLRILSAVILLGVTAQAVMGGFVVWMDLDANLVGFHYVASLVLVGLTTAYLVRYYSVSRTWEVPRSFLAACVLIAIVLFASLLFGVLTTNAGPHSGDASIARTGFDATALSHVHAWPGYVLLGLLAVAAIWAGKKKLGASLGLVVLFLLTGTQAAVGVFQVRSGLPALAVGVHMVLAALIVAVMTLVLLRIRVVREPDAVNVSAQKEHECP